MTVRTAESGTLPAWAAEALGWVGLRWPEGDAAALSAAGDAWVALARTLREALSGSGTGGADSIAARVWTANAGIPFDAFRAWWTHARGPKANLTNAANAAEQIGGALKGMSVQVTVLKAAYIAQLASLVAALVAAGLLVAGTFGLGTLVAAGGTTIAIGVARQAMIRALQAAIAAVTLQLVGVLLRGSAELLRPAPAETAPSRQRDRRPDPRPDPLPVPFPIPGPGDQTTRRPRCEYRPGTLTPLITGIPPGNLEGAYTGTGLERIDKRILPDGSRQIVIDGVIRDPIPRAGFESRLHGLDRDLGLPPGRYHAAHTWGPGFGSEAAAGIYLAPAEVNLGFQSRAEDFMRGLHQTVPPDGWVELRAVTTTHPSSAFGNTGANLSAGTDYEATVCRQGRIMETYRFGIEIGAPSNATGTFSPGRVTVYGLPGP